MWSEDENKTGDMPVCTRGMHNRRRPDSLCSSPYCRIRSSQKGYFFKKVVYRSRGMAQPQPSLLRNTFNDTFNCIATVQRDEQMEVNDSTAPAL